MLNLEEINNPKILPESVKSYFAALKETSPASSVSATLDLIISILLEAACELRGDLHCPAELTVFKQDEDHVMVTGLNHTFVFVRGRGFNVSNFTHSGN